MAFHWGGAFVKHWPQDIIDEVPMAQNDPNVEMTDQQEHEVPFYNGKTGEILTRFRTTSTRRISRTKLRLLLSRGIDVRYGKRFVKLERHEDGVTAYFEDGSTAKGSMLVGCDSCKFICLLRGRGRRNKCLKQPRRRCQTK